MKTLEEHLNFDAIDIAENIFTKTEDINALSLLLHIDNTRKKNQLLQKADDSLFYNTVENYTRIIQELGFQKIFEMPFVSNYFDNEMLFVFANRELGILLKFDTFRSNSVNSCNFYYNWIPNDIKNFHKFTSSGHLNRKVYDDEEKYVWIGYHDGREAIRYKINNLKNNGMFLTNWIEQPFLWILHYMDTEDENYNYNKLNHERISMFPQWVKEMINFHD